MKRLLALAVMFGLAVSVSQASNLNLTVRSGNSSNIVVSLGAVVPFEIWGELGDDLNEGLALWGADVTYTCGNLDQMNTPTTPPMDNFVSSPTNTKGINNPLGYGGTPRTIGEFQALLQVGGGQNTIRNTAMNAPFPTGTPMIGVAWPGQPVMLANGSVRAPDSERVCFVNLTSPFANVILDGEALENAFLKTQGAGIDPKQNITNLRITVGPTCLDSSVPVCNTGTTPNGSWWRSSNNFALLTFGADITVPGAGQVKVRELTADGMFGEDVTGQFTYAVENNGVGQPRVLRVSQTGAVGPNNTVDGLLEHRKWYAIQNDGAWDDASEFKIDVLVQVGDANGDNRVNSQDVSLINNDIIPIPCNNTLTCAGRRTDTNGDNRVNSQDVSTVNGRAIPTPIPLTPPKPSGHACDDGCPQ